MRNINLIDLLIVVVFMYSIIKGIVVGYSSYNLKRNIVSFENTIIFFFSLVITIILGKKFIMPNYMDIVNGISSKLDNDIGSIIRNVPKITIIFLYVVISIFIINIFIAFMRFINNRLIFNAIDGVNTERKKRKHSIRFFLGILFTVPKSIILIIVTVFLISISGVIVPNNKILQLVNNSIVYNEINEKVVSPVSTSYVFKYIPTILDNSFKVIGNDSNTGDVILYNGVTIEEGIKSNSDIDEFAVELTKNIKGDRGKVEKLYMWISSNIKYDYEKAGNIMEENYVNDSGAITAFNSKKGVCFDYSCLLVSFCRAIDIKSRIVTGEGFTGTQWAPHAWNEVYLEDEDRWINVDTTFATSGYYFDSYNFNKDHIKESVIGEW